MMEIKVKNTLLGTAAGLGMATSVAGAGATIGLVGLFASISFDEMTEAWAEQCYRQSSDFRTLYDDKSCVCAGPRDFHSFAELSRVATAGIPTMCAFSGAGLILTYASYKVAEAAWNAIQSKQPDAEPTKKNIRWGLAAAASAGLTVAVGTKTAALAAAIPMILIQNFFLEPPSNTKCPICPTHFRSLSNLPALGAITAIGLGLTYACYRVTKAAWNAFQHSPMKTSTV